MDNNWQYDYSNGYAQPQYTQPSSDPSMGGPEPSDQQPKKKRPGTKKTLAAVALVRVCALAGVGGGVLGALLAWPMWRALDLWGSMLLFIFVILADLMLITGISLYQVSDYVQALFGDVRQNLSERREERRAAREAAPEPRTHGRQVIALAGIGKPKPFLQSLRERYEVVAEMTPDDHHVYKVRDMHALEALLSEHPGAVIVTTEKDAVKMTRREKVPEAVRRTLYYQPIHISFLEDSATDFLQKLDEDVRGN